MSRAEFSKVTKRSALKRANGRCEANGAFYGFASGERCGASLSHGVEFDHIILEANSHDNGLENCYAVCIPCHRHKTTKRDTPIAAKTKRQQDKARGIKSPARSFQKPVGMKYDWSKGRYVKENS